jgi:transmembrane sensor
MNTEDQFGESLVFPERGIPKEALGHQRSLLLEKLDRQDEHRVRNSARLRWMQIAAGVLLVISLTIMTVSERKRSVYAGVGEKIEKTLPDGSVIILNSDSRIRYSKDLQRRASREVWVRGEAFFKVARTPKATPFIVHTEHFDVMVTGTQFNLNSEREQSSILLTEGSVKIQTPDGKVIRLKPGEYFAMDGSATRQEEEQVATKGPAPKPEAVLSWLDKNLVFENTPLRDVAREIEMLYKVTVVIRSEKAGQRQVTGILPNDNLDILIRALEVAAECTITKDGKNVIIEENK